MDRATQCPRGVTFELGSLPSVNDLVHHPRDPAACGFTIIPLKQETVIARLCMPDVRDHREPHRLAVKCLCRRRAPNPAAVLPTRMGGDLDFPARRTPGKQLPNPARKGI